MSPLGSLRRQRSQGALRRQKNCAFAAFRNISALLENCRKPCWPSFFIWIKSEDWNRTSHVIEEEDEASFPADQGESGSGSRRPSSAGSLQRRSEEKVSVQRRALSAGKSGNFQTSTERKVAFKRASSGYLHQLNSKNYGPVLSFKTIFRHRNCFLSSSCCNGWQGLTWIETWKFGSTFSSFNPFTASEWWSFARWF